MAARSISTAIAAALKAHDARFVIDATHGAGVMRIDVRTLDPDFLVFPTYKWVLGPYGRAFLYVAKRWQNGMPIEQAGSQRRAHQFGTRALHARYGVTWRMHDATTWASAIITSRWRWPRSAWRWSPTGAAMPIIERLRMLTDRLADGLRNSGVLVSEPRVRAPHILSLRFPRACRTT